MNQKFAKKLRRVAKALSAEKILTLKPEEQQRIAELAAEGPVYLENTKLRKFEEIQDYIIRPYIEKSADGIEGPEVQNNVQGEGIRFTDDNGDEQEYVLLKNEDGSKKMKKVMTCVGTLSTHPYTARGIYQMMKKYYVKNPKNKSIKKQQDSKIGQSWKTVPEAA